MGITNFKQQPLYPQVKSFWNQLDRWLGGSQNLSGCNGKYKNFRSFWVSDDSLVIQHTA